MYGASGTVLTAATNSNFSFTQLTICGGGIKKTKVT